MLKRHAPSWVYAGGFLLTSVAGCVNAVTVASALQSVTHMTGTVFLAAHEALRGDRSIALRAASVVLCFFLGAALAGFLIRDSSLEVRGRYRTALLFEAGLLVGAWLLLSRGEAGAEFLAAGACGLQNALATTYSDAILRTTHLTGIVTDLGIAIGHALRQQPVEWLRFRIHLVLLLGFIFGSAGGGLAFSVFGTHALLAPIVAIIVAAFLATGTASAAPRVEGG